MLRGEAAEMAKAASMAEAAAKEEVRPAVIYLVAAMVC